MCLYYLIIDQRIQYIKTKPVIYKKSRDNGSCTNNTKSKCKSKELNLLTLSLLIRNIKNYLEFSSFNLRIISVLIATTHLNFLFSFKPFLSRKSFKSSHGFKLSLLTLSFSFSSLLSFLLLLSLLSLKSLRQSNGTII